MSRLERLTSLNVVAGSDLRRTSIIGTIGPKTNNPETLVALRKAGLNIVRMNFSHGSYEYHKSVIDNARKSEELYPGRPLAIALTPRVQKSELVPPPTMLTTQSHQTTK